MEPTWGEEKRRKSNQRNAFIRIESKWKVTHSSIDGIETEHNAQESIGSSAKRLNELWHNALVRTHKWIRNRWKMRCIDGNRINKRLAFHNWNRHELTLCASLDQTRRFFGPAWDGTRKQSLIDRLAKYLDLRCSFMVCELKLTESAMRCQRLIDDFVDRRWRSATSN